MSQTPPAQQSSFSRGLAVLDLVCAKGRSTVAEVQSQLGLSESTAYRYCRDLREAGFLAVVDGYLVPSARLAGFDAAERRGRQLRAAEGAVRRIARQTGLNAVLAVRAHLAAECLAQSPAPGRPLVGSHRPGSVFALHSGATAVPLLAWAPARVRERFLAGFVRPYTRNTPSSPELAQQLAAIREQGYAISSGWLDPGLCAIGVPVLVGGSCELCLSVVGPKQPVVVAEPDSVAALHAAAEEIATALARQEDEE